MKEVLDKIEKWLKESPTHPHIEYMTASKEEYGEAIVAIEPCAVETWNSEAMLSEWSSLRQELEKDA